MGTLANSVFQALMGWIRAVALEIWNTFSSPEGTTLMGWVGAHWKGLAFGMCVLGLTVDLIVYLFRWQPYRVWRSQRRGRQSERHHTEENSAETETDTFDQVYDLTEGIPAEAAEELDPSLIRRAQQEMEADQAAMNEAGRRGKTGNNPRENKRSSRRKNVARYVENAYDGETEEEIASYHREWNPGGRTEICEEDVLPGENYRDEMTDETEIQGRTTEKFAQAIRPRRRRSVRAMLTDRQDQVTETPDQLIDRNEAYRQPVYPRRWTEEEEGR